MAISHIGSQGNAGTTVTIPAHQIGDLILIFAYRAGNNTAPSVPAAGGTVPTWTIIGSASGGNTNSSRLHYAVATATNTTSGTWTSATELIAVVYRGTKRPGGNNNAGSTGTSISYPALSMQRTDGTSWVAGFAGHRTATNVEGSPSGMTNRTSAGTEVANHDTNATVSSWSAQSVTVNASSGWRARTVELLDAALSLLAGVGSFAQTGIAAGLYKGFTLSAAAGTFTLTGIDADVVKASNPNKVLTADVGSLGLTGIDAGLLEDARLTADPGVFTLSGIDAGTRATRLLSGGFGSFTFSGIDAGVLEAARLNADAGIFTLSGIDASTSASRLLVAQTGTYIFTGISAALIKTGGGNTDLIADTGSFLITPSGGSGGFSLGSLFSLDQGSFSLVGNTIPLRKTYRLSLETGLLQYGGNESVNRIRRVLQPEQVDKVYAGNFVDIYPFLKVKRSPPRRHPSGRGIAPRF
jgi:hypothetical protein